MRNPLSSVKIKLQALRRRVQGDPAHSELGDIALEQLARVERMLSDLLGYGKPLRLSLKPTAFEKIAKDVLEVVRKEADEKKVSVGIDDRLDSTPIVADAEQIRRALTNLVTNAIQAVAVGVALVAGIAARIVFHQYFRGWSLDLGDVPGWNELSRQTALGIGPLVEIGRVLNIVFLAGTAPVCWLIGWLRLRDIEV
jgi:nitrogen-specific signal transduction histidine kinase